MKGFPFISSKMATVRLDFRLGRRPGAVQGYPALAAVVKPLLAHMTEERSAQLHRGTIGVTFSDANRIARPAQDAIQKGRKQMAANERSCGSAEGAASNTIANIRHSVRQSVYLIRARNITLPETFALSSQENIAVQTCRHSNGHILTRVPLARASLATHRSQTLSQVDEGSLHRSGQKPLAQVFNKAFHVDGHGFADVANDL
jgi:hypothetical protein